MKATQCTVLTAAALLLPAGLLAADETDCVSLFDGKSLEGWEIMNGGKFSVKDGVIRLDRGRGWLRSQKEYADFVLKLEVRFLEKNQDSGVFLRATKEGNNWPRQRYEVQAHNNASMARLFGAKFQRDADLVADVLHETDEWNTYEITCIGPRIEVRLNGKLVTTSDDLKRPKGYIGLQGEGGLLEFRNIGIREKP